jgi:hypothetical protein
MHYVSGDLGKEKPATNRAGLIVLTGTTRIIKKLSGDRANSLC